MLCYFCGERIHFFEDFYSVGIHHFHIQVVTLNGTERCRRYHNKTLEALEKKLLKEKK